MFAEAFQKLLVTLFHSFYYLIHLQHCEGPALERLVVKFCGTEFCAYWERELDIKILGHQGNYIDGELMKMQLLYIFMMSYCRLGKFGNINIWWVMNFVNVYGVIRS